MSKNQLPDLPVPVRDWGNPNLDPMSVDPSELVKEIQQLRTWCGQVFMSIKNAEVSAAGAETAASQAVKSVETTNENYMKVDKRLSSLDNDLALIMVVLGITEEGEK